MLSTAAQFTSKIEDKSCSLGAVHVHLEVQMAAVLKGPSIQSHVQEEVTLLSSREAQSFGKFARRQSNTDIGQKKRSDC